MKDLFTATPAEREIIERIAKRACALYHKYGNTDVDELDIQITQTQSEDNNGTVPVLYANIPIKSMRKMNHED